MNTYRVTMEYDVDADTAAEACERISALMDDIEELDYRNAFVRDIERVATRGTVQT